MYKVIYDLSMYAYIGFQSTYKWVLFLYCECMNRYCFCTVNNVNGHGFHVVEGAVVVMIIW